VKEATFGEGGIDDRRGVPFAKYEPIAIRICWTRGIDAQNPRVEHGKKVGHRKAAADMGGFGRMDHAQSMHTDPTSELFGFQIIRVHCTNAPSPADLPVDEFWAASPGSAIVSRPL